MVLTRLEFGHIVAIRTGVKHVTALSVSSSYFTLSPCLLHLFLFLQHAKMSKQMMVLTTQVPGMKSGHIVATKAGGACDKLRKSSALIDRLLAGM